MEQNVKRQQSPDYPAIGLKEAIHRLGKLFKEIQTHPATREHVARALGWSGMNGASASAIAALRKYGLLAKRGDTLRITDLGLQITIPQNDSEKNEAIRSSALHHALFQELHHTFGSNPPSDELLRNHLLRKGFIIGGANIAIAAYRDTMSLVDSLPGQYNSEDTLGLADDEDASMTPNMPAPAKPATAPVPLSSEDQAHSRVEDIQIERRLFNYTFENAGGGVGVVVRGQVDTEEALDVINVWIEMKRKEINRKRLQGVSGSKLSPDSVQDEDMRDVI